MKHYEDPNEVVRRERAKQIRASGLSRDDYETLRAEEKAERDRVAEAARQEIEAAERQAQAELEARAERDEQATLARMARVAAFCAGVLEPGTSAPDGFDVAIALSRAHLDGEPVAMSALLVEAGLATTEEEAQRLCKARVGQDLGQALTALRWGYRRLGAVGRQRVPPRRVA